MNGKTRTEFSIINTFTGLAANWLNLLLGFACRMIFVRTLSETYLGINGLFSNILSVLSLSELGIGTAIVYALYKPIAKNDKNKITVLMKFYQKAYFIIGSFIGICGIGLMPFLHLIIHDVPAIKENIYLIYLLFLFSTASSYFFSYRSTLIIANQKNYQVLGIGMFFSFFQNTIQIIVLLIWKEYLLYLVVQIICNLLNYITVSLKAKKDYPYICEKCDDKLSKEEKHILYKDIRALTITKLSGILVNNTDNIVITYFNGLITTGIASNYTLLIGTLSSIINQLFAGLTASVGNYNAQETDERKYVLFKAVSLSNFWFFGWGAIGIIVVASDLVLLLFGPKYVLGIQIPIIMALNFYIVGMQSGVWIFKNTMGLFKRGQYILLVTAFFNILGDIILGKSMGLFGIFLATVLARLLTNAWYDPYAVFKYGLKRNPIKYFYIYIGYLATAVTTGYICWLVCGLISCGLVLQVILKMIVCSLLTNIIFLFIYRKTKGFMFIKNKLLSVKIIRGNMS